jgi:hypothetical protein
MRANALQPRAPESPLPPVELDGNGTAPVSLKALSAFKFTGCIVSDPVAAGGRRVCVGASSFNFACNKKGVRVVCSLRGNEDVSPDVSKGCPYSK